MDMGAMLELVVVVTTEVVVVVVVVVTVVLLKLVDLPRTKLHI
jgi:hypothetical protein